MNEYLCIGGPLDTERLDLGRPITESVTIKTDDGIVGDYILNKDNTNSLIWTNERRDGQQG